MSSVIAIVKSIVGQVFAMSPEGFQRLLVEGDRLFKGDQLETGLEGMVTLELADGRTLDLGRDTQWSEADAVAMAAPSPVQPEPQTPADEVAQLQKAIEAGADPTRELEATAAGPSAAGGGGSTGGGSSFVMLEATAERVAPNIGFRTSAAALTTEALAEEEALPLDAAQPQDTLPVETLPVPEGPNSNPQGQGAAITTDEGTPVQGLLTAIDPDRDTLTYSLETGPSNGILVINPDGSYTYTPNGNFNGSDSFTAIVDDGKGGTDTITVTIGVGPVNDAPEVAPINLPAINEDGSLIITQDQLLAGAMDVDGDALSVENLTVTGGQGTLVDNGDGTWTFTPNPDWTGQVSFDFNVSDGTTSVSNNASLTVNPVNDAAILGSADVQLSETGAILTTGGTLSISDVDSPATFVAQSNTAGTYGSFSIDAAGVWTYVANSAFNELNVGDSVSDTFVVVSADGTPTSVSVTLNGSNDAAILSSASVQLTETNAPLSTSGTLSISDVDSPATFVAQANTAGTYGSFSIDAAGAWTYVANSAFNELNVGDSYTDTFVVLSADGTPTSVTVTINGSNDAAVLSSAAAQLTETNAPLSTGGTLSISDVDSPATFVPQNGTAGTYGSFSIDATGAWIYVANSAFNQLNVGDSLTDTFVVLSADGTPTSVTVTINGSNDSALLSSASVQLTETNASLSTGGTLSISDVDSPATFVAQSNTAGTYGSFSLDAAGVWTYVANSAFNQLNVGDSLSDTLPALVGPQADQ